MESKAFYLSKTFWVNIIAVIAMFVQTQTGFIIDVEAQAAILAIVNLLLRAFTGSEVTFGGRSFLKK